MNFTKTRKTTLILLTILVVATFTTTHAARADPDETFPQEEGIPRNHMFRFPLFNKGFGSSASGSFEFGYGGPNGGFSSSGPVNPTTVCEEEGPCYKMKLVCPANCYKSFSKSGDGFNYGGGAGGCNFDCKTSCAATC